MIKIQESKNLITKNMYDNLLNAYKKAKQNPHNLGKGFGDYQENNTTYFKFSDTGLTVVKYIKGHYYAKRVNYWTEKTLQEINEELNEQDWKLYD